MKKGTSKGYVGGGSFPNEQPVCKPVVPGRRPKPLEGPVHPGFAGKPKQEKKSVPIRPVIQRSDQNDDLYKPIKKKK